VPKAEKEVKKDEERLGHTSLSPLKVFVEEFPSSENLQPLVKSLSFLKIPIHQTFDAINHCFPSNPAAWQAPGSCSASCSPYARQSCSWWPCPPKLPPAARSGTKTQLAEKVKQETIKIIVT
jgi:hypothetical protein